MDRPSHYKLRCLECGALIEDSTRGFLLSCPRNHRPALLRAEYQSRGLASHRQTDGLFAYSDWLPVRRAWPDAAGPATYRSTGLGAKLGLSNLTIVFNGYWPERGALLETCSFKELEALSVLARVPESEDRTLVVASAGNTGRAFLQVASRYDVPALVVVPEMALPNMWTTVPKSPNVKLAVISGNSDYHDAIRLSHAIARLDTHYAEGGAGNVARRDGMGTTMLAATEEIGHTPDHYVQAVGSGTGGIAAWEMTLRLLAAGSYGSRKTQLHLVQNAPFSIMTDAWRSEQSQLAAIPEERAREQIRELHAPVLSNRHPPYAVRGGVFDALSDTDGRMYSVSNREALVAGRLFAELEGCDLDPAAEVAVAGLVQAVESGAIEPADSVALNITGGGTNNLEQTGKKRYLKPDIIFDAEELRNGTEGPEFMSLVEERIRDRMEG